MTIHHAWPWLGIALIPFIAIFARCAQGAARVAWIGFAVYIAHQFEEHGIDALGRAYAFRAFFCESLQLDPCTAPESFITAVNPGTVWIASMLAIALSRRRALALSAIGIPLVNVPAHVGPALLSFAYNPGLCTALLLFVPYCLWGLRGATGLERVAVIAAGVAVHVVLIASIQAFLHGAISETALAAIQIANGLVPASLIAIATRRVHD